MVLDSPGVSLRSLKFGSDSKPSLITSSTDRKPGAESKVIIRSFEIPYWLAAAVTTGMAEEIVIM